MGRKKIIIKLTEVEPDRGSRKLNLPPSPLLKSAELFLGVLDWDALPLVLISDPWRLLLVLRGILRLPPGLPALVGLTGFFFSTGVGVWCCCEESSHARRALLKLERICFCE